METAASAIAYRHGGSYAGAQALLLSVEAPNEEAPAEFLPTFEAMLASIEAAEE